MGEKRKYFLSSVMASEGIRHGFFTKEVDFLPPPVEDFNKPDPNPELMEHIDIRKNTFKRVLGITNLALPVQVHGKDVWELLDLSDNFIIRGPESDAAITNFPATGVGVLTADCVPVLIASKKSELVGAIHAGWRGLYGEIIFMAVRKYCQLADVTADNVIAAIGPSIGRCCYEVDENLADKFKTKFDWIEDYIDRKGIKPKIDLSGIAMFQLASAKLNAESIDDIGLCTMCKDEHFHSYRKDGNKSGRQLSAIAAGRQ